MAATIARNDSTLLTGARIAGGTPLIPYRYQEAGNFIFEAQGGEVPYYTRFGVTQFLIFATAAELVAARG